MLDPATCIGCGAPCDLTGINVWCFVHRDDSGWSVDLSFNAVSPNVGYAAVDGDVYSVKVVLAESGDVLVETQDTVTYSAHYPNGEDCDAEPCRTVISGPFSREE